MDTVSTVEKKKKFYITTAINYTNGAPHFGHAYEVVAADVIARYRRIQGCDVFFMTGTDEHGQKVADTAEKEKLKPIELCDKYVAMFQSLNKRLDISNDYYIRTTFPKHYKTCQWIWEKAAAAGDIYLGEYEGWYSVREERFFTENEAQQTDYKDPGSGLPLTKRSESSYFFKMSKYKDRLLQHIKNNAEFIVPDERKNDVLARLESDDLNDLSISRATFDWGVPVPDCPGVPKTEAKHVMYVWFDALTNYISGVDYPTGDLAQYWPANVHLIGKDIVWFHSVIWPCMLMSAGVALPKTVLCHGFVNGPDGRKMSKSYGNVVDPNTILDKYTADNLRYFLIKEGVFGNDFNFSEEAMINTHDFELAATLGNLVQRGLTLTLKNLGGVIPDEPYTEIFSVAELKKQVNAEFERYRLQSAVDAVFTALKATNKWLSDEAPWHLKPDEKKKQGAIIRTVLEALYICGHFIAPVIPNAMKLMYAALDHPMVSLENLNGWGNLKAGAPVTALPDVLFRRIQKTRHEKSETEEKPKVKVNVNDISRWKLVVGKILSAKKHPEAEHLYVEEIDIGAAKPAQIVSGLAKHIPLDQMAGKMVVVVGNMKPKKFRGVQSEGMVIAANNADNTVVELVSPPSGAPPGERVRFTGYSDDNAGEPLNDNVITKVKADLKTDANGVATYKGVPFTTSAGSCTVQTLKDAQLG